MSTGKFESESCKCKRRKRQESASSNSLSILQVFNPCVPEINPTDIDLSNGNDVEIRADTAIVKEETQNAETQKHAFESVRDKAFHEATDDNAKRREICYINIGHVDKKNKLIVSEFEIARF